MPRGIRSQRSSAWAGEDSSCLRPRGRCSCYRILFLSVIQYNDVNVRPTVSRPVRLGVRSRSGTCDQFFFLLEISFRQLRLCYFVAPSLTRGRVCNLLLNCFWTLPEQSHLDRSPAELTVFIPSLLFHYRVCLTKLSVPLCGHRITALSVLRLADIWVDYNTHCTYIATWEAVHSGLGSGYFATDGQSASLSWCEAPSGAPWPDFYYCRTFAVIIMRSALPDERTVL
jgi:hypothetical protein